jgi:uncharacterized protein (TIGR03382 family)
MRLVRVVSSLLVLLPLCASAQTFLYPVAWPKAGGGMLVAVPLADGIVHVHRRTAIPHQTGYNSPFPLGTPTAYNGVAGQPIILFAPELSTPAATNDQDDFFLLVSNQRLVLSIADDERHQPGSPDRIYFMPADTGTFRGRTFYSGASGGDPSERLRIFNLTGTPGTATVHAWSASSGAWIFQGTAAVPPGSDAEFDPSAPQTAYRVTTDVDALVVVGYLGDNATATAPDFHTGQIVGTELIGFGTSYHLRAVDPVSYTVETRPAGSTTWAVQASGTLGADQAASGTVGFGDLWVRIKLAGGVGWALVGTPSLLSRTEWNGYYLPAQRQHACIVGQRFFTNSSARTISMIPQALTTVRIYDEASGALLNTYTSQGPWEFHNFFHPQPVRVEFTNGAGAVLLVGTLNFGNCEEAVYPGNCGILEGGYSLPALSSFRCPGGIEQFQTCTFDPTAGCYQTEPDGGTAPDAGWDAGAEVDAGAPVDSGTPLTDAGTATDAGTDDAGVIEGPTDAGAADAGAADSGEGTTRMEAQAGCGCAGVPAALPLLLGLWVMAARRRRARPAL